VVEHNIQEKQTQTSTKSDAIIDQLNVFLIHRKMLMTLARNFPTYLQSSEQLNGLDFHWVNTFVANSNSFHANKVFIYICEHMIGKNGANDKHVRS
jgi:hypothetical protein